MWAVAKLQSRRTAIIRDLPPRQGRTSPSAVGIAPLAIDVLFVYVMFALGIGQRVRLLRPSSRLNLTTVLMLSIGAIMWNRDETLSIARTSPDISYRLAFFRPARDWARIEIMGRNPLDGVCVRVASRNSAGAQGQGQPSEHCA